jgi:hypothetical protein
MFPTNPQTALTRAHRHSLGVAVPIGSMAEAETILTGHRAGSVPNGWEKIGSGEFRTAYLSPTGIVYKVERGFRKGQSNRGEYEHILELRYSEAVKESGAYIPKAWLYEIGRVSVIAMEYCAGINVSIGCILEDECQCGPEFSECGWDTIERISYATGLTDLHKDNVVFLPAQKRWALIDLGA